MRIKSKSIEKVLINESRYLVELPFYRIEASSDIPEFGVKKGDLGGLVGLELFESIKINSLDRDNDFNFWIDSSSMIYIASGLVEFPKGQSRWLIKNSKLLIFDSTNSYASKIVCDNLQIIDSKIIGDKLIILGGEIKFRNLLGVGHNCSILKFYGNIEIDSPKFLTLRGYVELDSTSYGVIKSGELVIRSKGILTDSEVRSIGNKITIECEQLTIAHSTIAGTNILNSTEIAIINSDLFDCSISNKQHISSVLLVRSKLCGTNNINGSYSQSPVENKTGFRNCFIKDITFSTNKFSDIGFVTEDRPEDTEITELIKLNIKNGVVK